VWIYILCGSDQGPVSGPVNAIICIRIPRTVGNSLTNERLSASEGRLRSMNLVTYVYYFCVTK
jgi:hypothetical protein